MSEEVISEKYKKTCKYLNQVEKLLILISAVTGRISVYVFPSLVCVAVGITNSPVGIQNFAITAEIKNCKSVIKKKRKSKIK